MLFDAIFLTAFFLTWALLGFLVWLVWSLRRRAVGALWAFPFALLGGMAGGVLVPLLGLDDGWGVGVSMIAAPVGATLLTGAAYRVWDDYDFAARFAALGARGELPANDVPRAGDQDPQSIDSDPPAGSEE